MDYVDEKMKNGVCTPVMSPNYVLSNVNISTTKDLFQRLKAVYVETAQLK